MKRIQEWSIGKCGKIKSVRNKYMFLKRIENVLLLLFLFFLPWQTRYIWHYGQLNGGPWEYGTFSVYGTEILLWLILVIFFVHNFLKKEVWLGLFKKKNFFNLLFIVSLALTGVSVILSENLSVSYYYILRILEALALVVVLISVHYNRSETASSEGDRTGNSRLAALWLGGVLQGVLAIYQFLTQHVFASSWLGMASQEAMQGGASVIEFADQRWLRAYGSFGSPNSLGIYLAVLFVLGFILYLKTISPRYKIIYSAGQLLILSGLLLSFSRGAWLSGLLGITCLSIILFYKHKDFLPLFFKQTAFAAGVIIFWVVIFYPVFTARFNLHNRLEAQSIFERQGQYKEAASFIKAKPFFGVGPGAYTYSLSKKYPDLPFWQYQPIHNIYVLALVEMGGLGILFLLLFFIQLLKIVLKNNFIYLPVLAVLFSAGMFDHWLLSMFTGIVFFCLVIALGVSSKLSSAASFPYKGEDRGGG
jgi:O-antigen ligase